MNLSTLSLLRRGTLPPPTLPPPPPPPRFPAWPRLLGNILLFPLFIVYKQLTLPVMGRGGRRAEVAEGSRERPSSGGRRSAHFLAPFPWAAPVARRLEAFSRRGGSHRAGPSQPAPSGLTARRVQAAPISSPETRPRLPGNAPEHAVPPNLWSRAAHPRRAVGAAGRAASGEGFRGLS